MNVRGRQITADEMQILTVLALVSPHLLEKRDDATRKCVS